MGVVEKIFQIIFICVMSIGVLGLPVYFLLNARKKRLSKEGEENINND